MSAAVVAVAILAGGIASLARYGLTLVFAGRPARIPVAVLIVNVVGSTIAGAIVALSEAGILSHDVRTIVVTGFCGGLTTFSTFSVETVQLVLDRKPFAALASVAANLVLGVGGCVGAWALVHALVG